MINNRKKIPNLRSLQNQEDATIKKARASWQMFTIMAEFIEATEHLSEIGPAISIYGSARLKSDSTYCLLAEQIAEKFSEAGFAVLTGGGPGIMEAANKGAQKGLSPSVGLNIELPHEQHSNPFIDIALKFRHFFTRKVTFVKNSMASIILPGGFGTLDELTEVLTLTQTGKCRKMPIILVGTEFWADVMGWFEKKLVPIGVISKEDLHLIQLIDHPEDILKSVLRFYEENKDPKYNLSQEGQNNSEDRMFYL